MIRSPCHPDARRDDRGNSGVLANVQLVKITVAYDSGEDPDGLKEDEARDDGQAGHNRRTPGN
jgi:hypothetical protein